MDFSENHRPYVLEMKKTVRSDTALVALMALEAVCARYDLEGGIMSIDEPGYKGTVFFATNRKRAEEEMKNFKF